MNSKYHIKSILFLQTLITVPVSKDFTRPHVRHPLNLRSPSKKSLNTEGKKRKEKREPGEREKSKQGEEASRKREIYRKG